MKSLQLFAVWLLLLALPVQGLAAFTPSVRCADAPSSHAMHDSLQNHHGVASEAHGHCTDHPQQDEGLPADQTNGHSCCHHVFSGVPPATMPCMPVPTSGITPHVSLLATLYIPEPPQRPPRA